MIGDDGQHREDHHLMKQAGDRPAEPTSEVHCLEARVDEGVGDRVEGSSHVNHENKPLLFLIHSRVEIPRELTDVAIPLSTTNEALLRIPDHRLQRRLNSLLHGRGNQPVVSIRDRDPSCVMNEAATFLWDKKEPGVVVAFRGEDPGPKLGADGG